MSLVCVTLTEEGSIPLPEGVSYSVIESDGETAILEIPETFTRMVFLEMAEMPSTDEEGVTTAIEVPTYVEEEWEPDLSMCEPVTWEDVSQLIHFDLMIGQTLYTFRNTPGAVPAALDDEHRICLREYVTFPYHIRTNDTITPMTGCYMQKRHPTVPPLHLQGDRLYIYTPEDYDNVPVQDATGLSDGLTLASIKLYRDGQYVKHYARPAPEEIEE